MKRMILLSLIIVFGLTGCGIQKNDTILGGNFVVKSVESQGSLTKADVYIVVDKTSGANYYWVVAGQGRSLTPIYDKDGKIVIDKQ